MTRKKVYLILLAALLAGMTALMSAATVRIWQEGSARKAANPLEAVYTPERVEGAILRLSPLLFAVIGMTAAGLVLGIRDEKSARPVPSPEAERNLLAARLETPGKEIREERKKRQILRWVRWAVFALCMIPIAVYCADRGHFPESDLEAMLASLVLHTMPWAAAGLAVLLIGSVLEEKSITREIEMLRARLKAKSGGQSAAAESPSPARSPGSPAMDGRPAAAGKTDRGTAAVRAALLLAAALLIALGVLNGSLNDVLMKAINICSECIGLG